MDRKDLDLLLDYEKNKAIKLTTINKRCKGSIKYSTTFALNKNY